MLYRKVEPCIRRNKDKETHLRKVRFYFWVWALAPPKATENYYYTLTIPRGQLQEGRNYAQAQYDEVFRYHAMAQSLQVTKEEVMASVAATAVAAAAEGGGKGAAGRVKPRGVVFFNEGLMRENVNKNDGALTYQLRIVRP